MVRGARSDQIVQPTGRREQTIMSKLLACAVALAVSAPVALAEDVDLDQLKVSLERYQDVNVALADGYFSPDNHCVSAEGEGLPPELGAMGIHYIHPELLQITATEPRVDGQGTHTDWSRPAILIYEPQADGSLLLVAVENLVFEAAWQAAGNTEAPVLNGRKWDHMVDDPETPGDEAHGFTAHLDQHVWLWRENPAGILMPFNANVTCEHHKH
jgi:hypothetical protein